MYDELAVSIVVDERVPMRLRGDDRVEAVRRLSALSLYPQVILGLVRWDVGPATLSRFRVAHGIPAPAFILDGLSRAALGLERRRKADA